MQSRDELALGFALAIARPREEPAEVARRAYDLAEALLAEGARRSDADEAAAIAAEAELAPRDAPALPAGAALLDEPPPWLEEDWPLAEPDDALLAEADDAHFLELAYDPSWDVEPRWQSETGAPSDAASAPSAGPGLARTRAEPATPDGKVRSA
ncbi:MAG: hypothetical protein IT373_16875 [Polyangiaceae bacterium]|nr:hypothetical protein [Polyangiaceae bacterium]